MLQSCSCALLIDILLHNYAVWVVQAVETGASKAATQPWKTFLLANLAGECPVISLRLVEAAQHSIHHSAAPQLLLSIGSVVLAI